MDYDYNYTVTGTDLSSVDWTSLAGIWSLVAVMMIPVLIIGLALYIYSALALMKIAQRTGTPNAWLAWIPIGNMYLMTQVAKVPWWTFLGIFLAWIPIVGSLIILGLLIWWWYKIAERMGKPAWWGIMIAIVPIANLIFMGMLAWGKDEKAVK